VVATAVTPGLDEPIAFVATTENLYGTPLVNPEVISQVVATPIGVQVTAGESGTPLTSSAVTKYPVIAAPFELGAVKEIVAPSSPGVAVTFSGASGLVFGITAAVGAETGELPFPLSAVAVKV
jgi:hypothetical protein